MPLLSPLALPEKLDSVTQDDVVVEGRYCDGKLQQHEGLGCTGHPNFAHDRSFGVSPKPPAVHGDGSDLRPPNTTHQ